MSQCRQNQTMTKILSPLSGNFVLWDQLASEKFKMVPKLGGKPVERIKRKSNGKLTRKVKFLFPINCSVISSRRSRLEEQTDLDPVTFSEACAQRGRMNEWKTGACEMQPVRPATRPAAALRRPRSSPFPPP